MPDALQNAALLQRAKQQTVHRSNFPIEVREKRVKEKMKHYKSKLAEAVMDKNKENIATYLKKLIEVRAQLFVVRTEDEFGRLTTDQTIMERELKNYYRDCYRLRKTFDIFLNT